MKPVKLLTLTSRNYLIIYLVLTFFFFAVLYFSIRREVYESTDEVLYNKKKHITEQFKRNGGRISEDVFAYDHFSIRPVAGRVPRSDRYSDTLIFEPVDREWDEYRKLASSIEWEGRVYRLEIVNARLETHEIVDSIIQSLAVIFILMVAVFYLTTRYFSKKLWQPFYSTLRKLNDFEVDTMQGIDLDVSRIEEFTALNKSILELTERTRNSFINQKQFIENASHEMQTPLAITLSKLELLIEDPHLTEPQSEIIQALINSTQRLAKLNKTLLLLSKIENQQFMEKEEVRLKPLFEEILTYFEEQKENLQLSVTMGMQQDAAVVANPVLVDLLFTNLIKNAFSHNRLHGSVHLIVNDKKCTISNTSTGDAIPEGKLFQRFYKQSVYKDSWGLGLALVKKICTLNQWTISYKEHDGIHSFTVQYKV